MINSGGFHPFFTPGGDIIAAHDTSTKKKIFKLMFKICGNGFNQLFNGFSKFTDISVLNLISDCEVLMLYNLLE